MSIQYVFSSPSYANPHPPPLTRLPSTMEPSPQKCIVGGCARNCGKSLPKVLQNIKQLENVFSEIYVLISYDVSDDPTLDILQHYQSQFGHFEILLNDQPLSPIRTERIAHARNRILDRAEHIAAATPEYLYMCMLDMDEVCSSPMDIALLSSYLARDDWDALSFNRDDYYDIWALSVSPYIFSCHHWADRRTNAGVIQIMTNYMKRLLLNIPENSLAKVDSAFNGFAIYRLPKFADCRYSHLFAFEYMSRYNLDQNATRLGLPFPTEAQLRNSHMGYNDCEHKYFHLAAIHKNGARIRVSPKRLFANTSNWSP